MTGNFEVYLENKNGDLLHSKRNGGGRCDTKPEIEKLINKIRTALERENHTPADVDTSSNAISK